jgi:hypothetical protein
MNPLAVETSQGICVPCGSCDRSKDDFFILQDGSVVCADCVDLWVSDRANQN